MQDKLKKKYVGMVIETKKYGSFTLLDYVDKDNVKVCFDLTGYEVVARISNVVKGKVSDKLQKGVKGVGIKGSHPSRVDGVLDKSYNTWCNMLLRCYDKSKKDSFRNYQDCYVSENFKNLELFSEWCNKQIGFNEDGWHLDKDILVKGNKIYSEDTCCFVPQQLNKVILNSRKIRGKHPIGVTVSNSGFKANMSKYGKIVYLGSYRTVEEAFQAYKQAKEAYVKEVVNKWKDKIDPRVYNTLMKYEVEIND